MSAPRWMAMLPAIALAACAAGPPRPAPLDTRNEACASCRMAVSEARYASQAVAPGEVPRFFDDLGCLGAFVKAGRLPDGATVFVADHRTKEWVHAGQAVYTRQPGVATPMGSHVLAHASAASRDKDPDARGGAAVSLEELLGPAGAAMGSGR